VDRRTRGDVDDRSAHRKSCITEDIGSHIGMFLAQVSQENVLARADPPRNRLTNQSCPNDDSNICHFLLLCH
jgi:hypothetical protein